MIDLLLLVTIATAAFLLYRLRVPAPAAGPETPSDRLFAGSRFPTVARQAGFDPGVLRWFFWLARLTLAIGLPLALLAVWTGPAPLVLLAALALAGFLVPDLWLRLRRRARQRRIRAALSFFLDLLVALLYAGLTLEEAFRRAALHGLAPRHPLAREARLVSLELDAGEDRATAFRRLAERTGVSELRALAAALGMAVRHGASVESALESQAELLRTKRREGLRREIAAAATKAIFPVFLCGFPVFLVIVFFPALLEVIETIRVLAASFR